MKLDSGKILRGTVVAISEGLRMTEVKLALGGDKIITMMVSDAALQELDAKVGDELEVLRDSGDNSGKVWH